MTPQTFAIETGKIILENKNKIIDCYKSYKKESISAILLLFKENTMEYYYISESVNKPLFNKLKPFMVERLKLNQDKLGIISIDDNNLVSCHFLFN